MVSKKLVYNLLVGTGLAKKELYRATCLVYTGAGPSLIIDNYLKSRWKCSINHFESPSSGVEQKK